MERTKNDMIAKGWRPLSLLSDRPYTVERFAHRDGHLVEIHGAADGSGPYWYTLFASLGGGRVDDAEQCHYPHARKSSVYASILSNPYI